MQWVGSPNDWPRQLHDVVAIVLHTEVGTEHSAEAEFENVAAQVSAHYGVGLDGSIQQFVALADAAWANGILEAGNAWEPVFGSENPNNRTVSIETEDDGSPDSQPVTDAQYQAVLALCKTVILPAWPGITHLVAHHAISPLSRSCPAARWLASGRFDQLAQELGLTPLK